MPVEQGCSGRQNAATRRNMRRGEQVTVQGPVKKQQPDGMSHRGGGGGLWWSVRMGGSDNKGDGLASQPRRYRVPGQPVLLLVSFPRLRSPAFPAPPFWFLLIVKTPCPCPQPSPSP